MERIRCRGRDRPSEHFERNQKLLADNAHMKGTGKVALHYNGDTHVLDARDNADLDGGTPHGWENVGGKTAKALWVILG